MLEIIGWEPRVPLARLWVMSGAKILIVEDEIVVATHLEAIIEDRGHCSVGIAPDLRTAVELAAMKPDVALVDINLRDGPTGPEIAKQLAQYGVAVLFVTANPRMLEAAEVDAVGVLSKPWNEDIILAAVDYALDARQGIPLPAPPVGLTLLGAAD